MFELVPFACLATPSSPCTVIVVGFVARPAALLTRFSPRIVVGGMVQQVFLQGIERVETLSRYKSWA